jgi:hypothetical protein
MAPVAATFSAALESGGCRVLGPPSLLLRPKLYSARRLPEIDPAVQGDLRDDYWIRASSRSRWRSLMRWEAMGGQTDPPVRRYEMTIDANPD